MNNPKYNFTNNWFEDFAQGVWDSLIPQINPTRIFAIGTYEGTSACCLIEKLAATKEIEIHCFDTQEDGLENNKVGMFDVDKKF